MTVYLDLDRTLFRTPGFSKFFWEKLHTLYPEIDHVAAVADQETYYRTVGDLYFYDATTHLEDLGFDAEEVFARLETSELGDGRFEFDGANELVSALKSRVDVQLLTFGEDRYQRFKATLCPSISGLSVATTLNAKANFFKNLEGTHYLVDDKPIGYDLPDNIKFVQVSLEGKVQDENVPWPVLYSLHDVKEYFDEALH